MKHHKKKEGHENRLIADTERGQENILWPGLLSKGRNMNELLWRGEANLPIVQRIAVWLIGPMLIGMGACYFYLAVREEQGSLSRAIDGIFGIGLFLVGIRVFRNGFPRQSRRAD